MSTFDTLFASSAWPAIREQHGDAAEYVSNPTGARLAVTAVVNRVPRDGEPDDLEVFIGTDEVESVVEHRDWFIWDDHQYRVEKITSRDGGRWGLACVQ